MLVPKDLIVIDIETTGIDPINYSICQIGVAIVDRETLNILKTYESLVKPLEDNRYPPAMAIHGITEEQLNQAPQLEQVLSEIESLIKDPERHMLASWGVYFDVVFLNRQYEKIKKLYPFYHHSFDIKAVVSWELCKRGLKLRQWRLEDMYKKLGLQFEGKRHSALADTLGAIRLLQYVSGKKDLTKSF